MIKLLLRYAVSKIFHTKKVTKKPRQRQILQNHKRPILPREKTSKEQEIDRKVTQSMITVSLAAASPFISPSLGVIAAGSLLHMLVPVTWGWSKKLVKEKKTDPNMLWTLGTFGLMVTNHTVLGAATLAMYFAGQKLVLRTENHSRAELTHIMGEQPTSVWVMNDGVELEVPFESLKVGDVIIISAGQMIPIDGEIIWGEASVDQQRLTGEAQPAEKVIGDSVFAATVILSGQIRIAVQKAGEQTVATQIGKLLNDTVDYRSTTVLRSQAVFERMTLPILSTAVGATALFGPAGGIAILFNLPITAAVFISSLNVLTHLKKTSEVGVLVKDGRALEMLEEVDTVVFDKTGTLTFEEPSVGAIHSTGSLTGAELLRYAASVEVKQSHPVALALSQAASDQQLELYDIRKPDYEFGFGITAQVNQKLVSVGSERFMLRSSIHLSDEVRLRQSVCDENGISLVYVAINGQLEGIIELCPSIRPEAQGVIDSLQFRGLEVIIISGDREQPTRKMAKQLGIGRFFSEVLPQDKGQLIDQLQAQGKKVCFIGDGINDTVALKKANTSISLSGATSAATDTAQMILMEGKLTALPGLFDVSEQFNANTNRTLRALLLPVGASAFGVFFLHTGIAFAGAAYFVALSGGMASALLPAWKKPRSPSDKQQVIKLEAPSGKSWS